MDLNNSIVQSSLSYQCSNCQSTIATLWCESCSNHYCSTCSSDIHQHQAFFNHHPVSIEEGPLEILLCTQCSKQELEFFCHDCATDIICGNCLLSTHKDHNFVFINPATKDVVAEIISDSQNNESALNEKLNKGLEQINAIENINREKIEIFFTALHKMLDDRERILLEQISKIERKNKNVIESYKRQLFSHKQDKVPNSSKIFKILFSTNYNRKGIQVKQECLNNINEIIDGICYLQPSTRILHKIEGLDQLEIIERMLKRIRIVEEELQSRNTLTNRNPKLQRFLTDNVDNKKQMLRAQQLNNQDMIVIAHLLRETTALTILDLSMNKIGANGVHSLTTALLVNKTLTKLNLSENCIDDQGARYLADMLSETETLTELYLGNNQIGASGAQHLANALKLNKTLTILQLAGNTIGNEGVKYLGDTLKTNKTLTQLYLSGNMIQDEGALHLANAFKKETILTALYIAANGITERGARYLIDSLQHNVILSTLDCEFNQIGDDLIRHMQEILMIIAACKKDGDMENIRLKGKKGKAQVFP
ncbi:unnamed protein product [Adineta steineri]|uniref:B box-type domain-containing protein n=1 Tax=Adineta steineri TaxID=433720 RepID=A0A819IHP9_9BILA|nr:unnamed protein product [Adineta steineri]